MARWLEGIAQLIEAVATGKAFPGYETVIRETVGIVPIGGAGAVDVSPGTAGAPQGHASTVWLYGLAGAGLAIAAAPVVYSAYRASLRGKKARKAVDIGPSLEYASNRATTILAAMAPAIGMPIAYITIQALEDKGIIEKGLGDAVQTMIAAGVAAPAIGGALGLAAKVI